MKEKLINFMEAINLLRISQATFYRMLEDPDSKVPHYRIGAQYFFNPDELLAYFKRGGNQEQNSKENKE